MVYIVEIEYDEASFVILISSLKTGLRKELERYEYNIEDNDDDQPYHYMIEQPYQYYLQKYLQYDELINLFKKYGYKVIE